MGSTRGEECKASGNPLGDGEALEDASSLALCVEGMSESLSFALLENWFHTLYLLISIFCRRGQALRPLR